jgi:hypothetical protein
MPDAEYMYCFIREDLSAPQKIVQMSHAAAKIGERFHGDTSIVLCGAENEDSLQVIATYLDSHGIKHEIFWEPDLPAFTAIATEPLKGKARQPLKRFQLMK